MNLSDAIQLVKQGRKTEAQQALQGIIRGDPKNIQAWFWYVETCSSTAQRIQALETCLKLNPGNSQVMQALQNFRKQEPPAPVQAEQPKPAASPVSSYEEEPVSNRNEDFRVYDAYQPADQPVYNASNSYEDDEPTVVGKSDLYGFESYRSVQEEPVKVEPPQKKPWEMDPSAYVDNSMLSRPKKPVRTYSALDVWMTALTVQDDKAYIDLLLDPKMGLGRAFTWMAIAGFVSGLLVPVLVLLDPRLGEVLNMPDIGSMSPTAILLIVSLVSLIFTPITSMLGLAISGGLQNLLASLFGGGGNFTRTAYALAAYLAPMTVLTTLISIIPIVGGCLGFPLSIYSIYLNLRALRAAHSISTGAALGVIFVPIIVLSIFTCLLLYSVGGLQLT
jgi:hypothetical protein